MMIRPYALTASAEARPAILHALDADDLTRCEALRRLLTPPPPPRGWWERLRTWVRRWV
jgi:hypothetical protein